MGVSSSLLEKMRGGVCGGGVCITCSGLGFSTSQLINKCKMVPPEAPTPQSHNWWMRRGWSYGMGLSPILLQKKNQKFYHLKAAWWKIILQREGMEFNFASWPVWMRCVCPHRHCKLLSHHLHLPPLLLRQHWQLSCCTSKHVTKIHFSGPANFSSCSLSTHRYLMT